MYIPYLEVINKYTEPSSVVVCNYPQLINLITGRISIGSTFLFEVLNPKLERFSPDYILAHDSIFTKSSQLFKLKMQQARDYIKQYYNLVYHDPENHIMLFKHK
jgi:hypothetical protein